MHDGYRIDAPRPKPKRRTMQKTSTRGTVYVANGTTADLAIPCYYMEMHRPIPAEPHDRMRHDMLGWPTPDKPDSCCQEWDFANSCCRRTPHMKCCPPHCENFVDMRGLLPIHLKDEGYTHFEIEMTNPPTGLKADAYLDPDDDWIVRVRIIADVELSDRMDLGPFPATNIITQFSVFGVIDGESREIGAILPGDRRDLIFNGSIVVIPTAHLGNRKA